MEHMHVDLDLKYENIFKPKLSGHLMDAYYAELMQKQENGTRLTIEIQHNTFDEVLNRFISHSPIVPTYMEMNSAIAGSEAPINI